MKAEVRYGSLKGAQSARLRQDADRAAGRYREAPHDGYLIEIDTRGYGPEEIAEVIPMLEEAGDTRSARALTAIQRYTEGDFEKKVPNFAAFPKGLQAFLQEKCARGWVFVESGGVMDPYVVTGIHVHQPRPNDRDSKPYCSLKAQAFGPGRGYGENGRKLVITENSWMWEPAEVSRKSLPAILSDSGIIPATEELIAEHMAHLERFDTDMAQRFSEQLEVLRPRGDSDEYVPGARRVIHDLKMSEQKARPLYADSSIVEGKAEMPVQPYICTFDLSAHSFGWQHVAYLKPYEWDASLRDKLVLPQSHRDLLDVLTSDLSVFSGDIIRGKSAGNIIVCKGLPGLGKTLTAEVYSELTETPIYAVHSGSMGTTPSDVEKSLKQIFRRQRRWGCIVLLDEADVFVKQRGDNLIQNAIVAEFLRTLEYFEGLMFMTTNRPDDIDDAIISRAAAIITYSPPSESHRKRIWQVMFDQNGVKPPKGLVERLGSLFPTIAPRDIKMLLRLVLRVATAKDLELTPELFRRVAMFRAVEIADEPEELTAEEELI